MDKEMRTWPDVAFVIDFLKATDDGSGHWQPGTFVDPGHPNNNGHRLMYEAIPMRWFEEFKAKQ
jgi:hypothetical protein